MVVVSIQNAQARALLLCKLNFTHPSRKQSPLHQTRYNFNKLLAGLSARELHTYVKCINLEHTHTLLNAYGYGYSIEIS